MGTFITILTVVACILLVLVILVQNPKGGGLASGFSNANQIGGVQRTTDFLEKATWSLLGAVLVLSIFSSSFSSKGTVEEGSNTGIEQSIGTNAVQPQAPTIPQQGGSTLPTNTNPERSEEESK